MISALFDRMPEITGSETNNSRGSHGAMQMIFYAADGMPGLHSAAVSLRANEEIIDGSLNVFDNYTKSQKRLAYRANERSICVRYNVLPFNLQCPAGLVTKLFN